MTYTLQNNLQTNYFNIKIIIWIIIQEWVNQNNKQKNTTCQKGILLTYKKNKYK